VKLIDNVSYVCDVSDNGGLVTGHLASYMAH